MNHSYNNVPLLKSKLIIPEIPAGALFTNRIQNLHIPDYRIVSIVAPAGFGKTTSVLLSMKKVRQNVHWYRLEKEDTFLPVFYAHLIDTLLGSDDSGYSIAYRSLSSIDNITEDYPLLNAVIAQEAWARYADEKSHSYLIFDDFQFAAANLTILDTLDYLMVNLPKNVHFIILSRVNVGIGARKPALQGEYLQVGENELRFSEEEVYKLLTENYKLKMTSLEIHWINEYAEGWIAGINMLAHAAADRQVDLDNMPVSGDMQNIFDYLSGEVLKGLSIPVKMDLARISVLYDFTCNSLREIFGIENAEELIDLLEKNNIFIYKVNAEVVTYRYHALFRGAFQAILGSLYSNEEIENMRVCAANYYQKTGEYALATAFLLDAGHTDEAVHLAVIEGVKYVDAGNIEKCGSIIRKFSQEIIQKNVGLLFLYGASLTNSDIDLSFSVLHSTLLLTIKAKDYILMIKTAGLMLQICSQRNDNKKIEGIFAGMPKFKPLMNSKYIRRTLLISLFIKSAWSDKLSLSTILIKIIDRLGFEEPVWDYSYKLAKAMVCYRTGDMNAADVTMNQILTHPTGMVNDRWRAIGLALCQSIATHMGDVRKTQILTDEIAILAEKYSSDYALAHSFRYTSFINYLRFDFKGAISAIEKCVEIFSRLQNHSMVSVSRITGWLWEAEFHFTDNLLLKATAELKIAEEISGSIGYRELCIVFIGMICKKGTDFVQAEELLLKAYKLSKGKKALQSSCGTAMQLADLYYLNGNEKLEEKHLKLWAETASKNNFFYFREMNFVTLARVTARCVEKNICCGYILEMISRYFGANKLTCFKENPSSVYKDPKGFVVNCSHTDNIPKIIDVTLFGSFKMIVDGVEIGEKEWKTRKICGILKFLLANPDKPVSREVLSSAFWPDSDAKSASTSLRVALFELKKILARFGMPFDSIDALFLEGKNGFTVNNRYILHTDTERFIKMYKEYRNDTNRKSCAVQKLFEEMINLYTGDFLMEDLYDEWAVTSREHFRSIFIEVSNSLACIYLDTGEFEKAEEHLIRQMKADPFDEQACSMLLELYNRSGREIQANSFKRQFSKRFESEMGVKPDLKYTRRMKELN